MKSTLLIVGIIQFCLVLKFGLNNAGQFKLTNAVCKSHNESWITIHLCRLKAISRNKTVFNFNSTILHNVNRYHVEAQFFFKANGYKPWLYKPTFDVCRFLRKPYNPVIIMVFDLLKNYSNFQTQCPLLGSYYIDGFYISYDTMPLAWPSGEYLLKINFLFEMRLQFLTNVYFAVVE